MRVKASGVKVIVSGAQASEQWAGCWVRGAPCDRLGRWKENKALKPAAGGGKQEEEGCSSGPRAQESEEDYHHTPGPEP